jgi:hypothetical protein
MIIKLHEDISNALGANKLKVFGLDIDRLRWNNKELDCDLSRFSREKLLNLRTLLEPHGALKGVRKNIRDIDVWLEATQNADGVALRTIKQFGEVLKRFLLTVPGQRVYEKDADRDVVWGYYVARVLYHPPTRSAWGISPDYVEVELMYKEFAVIKERTLYFYVDQVAGKTVPEVLLEANLLPETDALRAEYRAHREMYAANVDEVGKQFLARGIADDDIDGNSDDEDDRRRYWYSKSIKTIRMDRSGDPARVVIDVFKETDTESSESAWYGRRSGGRSSSSDRDADFDRMFWVNYAASVEAADKDEDRPDRTREEFDDEQLGESGEVYVPLHPIVGIFNLKTHMRLRVHIAQLQEYEYQMILGEKLILPATDRRLIDMLLAGRGAFKDVVGGKSGGSLILCEGPPGTGKTLTAEIYSEVTARPLYSVQCSQLGTSAEALEEELFKTFARAVRWNAVLLLDEADVYVQRRGTDLTRNAIVGVFLRTLEYFPGVIFMTTNQVDQIDDAIASRAVARIRYDVPTPQNQARIWEVLAETAGAEIDSGLIKQIVAEYPSLSGRDVKNLLKLAMLVSAAEKKPITMETISFVKSFKPTRDLARDEGGSAELES